MRTYLVTDQLAARRHAFGVVQTHYGRARCEFAHFTSQPAQLRPMLMCETAEASREELMRETRVHAQSIYLVATEAGVHNKRVTCLGCLIY